MDFVKLELYKHGILGIKMLEIKSIYELINIFYECFSDQYL